MERPRRLVQLLSAPTQDLVERFERAQVLAPEEALPAVRVLRAEWESGTAVPS